MNSALWPRRRCRPSRQTDAAAHASRVRPGRREAAANLIARAVPCGDSQLGTMAIFFCTNIRTQLPNDLLPTDGVVSYDGIKPVFFGHYWMKGEPVLVSKERACLLVETCIGLRVLCRRTPEADGKTNRSNGNRRPQGSLSQCRHSASPAPTIKVARYDQPAKLDGPFRGQLRCRVDEQV